MVTTGVGKTGRIVAAFAFVNLLLIGIGFVHSREPAELRVTFLDVGQGDAAVIESPSGKVLVVDTGGILQQGEDDSGRRVVAPYLQQRGINHIDMLLLTHPDADHIGGAATLLERFPVGALVENGEESRSEVVTRLLTAAQRHHVPERTGRRGQIMDFGDGVTAQILAPTQEAAAYGVNNNASLVLRLQYGHSAFLLTGDAEADEEADILRSQQPLRCDVLKVGHHGSRSSSTIDFLNAARPRLAVISVGAHNVYGHPSYEVLDRLRDCGARIYRTDRNGAVTCRSDGVTIRVETMLH